MAGSLEFRWHDMDAQLLHIVAVGVVVVEGPEAEAEIADVLVQGHAVDQGVAIEIADDLTVVVGVVLALTVKALVASPIPGANLRTGKKIVVPNQGTEVTEGYTNTAVNRCKCPKCRIICLEIEKRYSITLYT